MTNQTINPNENPILIIDDDEEDITIMMESILSLHIDNEVLTFTEAEAALDYLGENHPPPFLILCDVNMPKIDGYHFRKKLDTNKFLKLRATPFIFLATSNQMDSVNSAYMLNIQGYFTKPKSYDGFVNMFRHIVGYWNASVLPNPFVATRNDVDLSKSFY